MTKGGNVTINGQRALVQRLEDLSLKETQRGQHIVPVGGLLLFRIGGVVQAFRVHLVDGIPALVEILGRI